MISDVSTAWKRYLASMGSPKSHSNTSWKHTTTRKEIAAKAVGDPVWRLLSDMQSNLLTITSMDT